jgi:hypothetical protein
MKAKDLFQYSLGALVVIGFFGLLIVLANQAIPAENKDLLNLTVGALIGSFATVVGYFYGSSTGSAQKTEFEISLMKHMNSLTIEYHPLLKPKSILKHYQSFQDYKKTY